MPPLRAQAMVVQILSLVFFLLGATGMTTAGGSESGSGAATEPGCVACLWLFAVLYGAGFGMVGALLPLVTLENFGKGSFGTLYGTSQLCNAVPSLIAPVVAGKRAKAEASPCLV